MVRGCVCPLRWSFVALRALAMSCAECESIIDAPTVGSVRRVCGCSRSFSPPAGKHLRMKEKKLNDQRGQHRQGSEQGVVLAMLQIQSGRES